MSLDLSVYRKLHKDIFKTPSQEFTYYRTYSHWLNDQKRREFYPETVDRYITYLKTRVKSENKIPDKVWSRIEKYLTSLEVVGSMRALWAAGKAADDDNTTMYNCAFLSMDCWVAFSEVLYILMCGTGVGYSVESRYVASLPTIKKQTSAGAGTYVIGDHRAGWADALKFGMETWANGQDVEFDSSQVRPKGTRLKTMGGRASGPEPLIKLLAFVRQTMLNAQGRKLTELEVSDIVCETAEIVVVGGVRRSSLICISDLGCTEIRYAKDFSKGAFPNRRFMANISATYEEKPSIDVFMEEWITLIRGKSGERGIFNRYAARARSPERRNKSLIMGTNPCGEILLRIMQFCNLSEVVVRPSDDFESLRDKVATAVWMGALQATFTHFPYLRPEWHKNCEEEQLLGVSLTGQMDNVDLLTESNIKLLKSYALKIARQASKVLGKNFSAAVTTGKPSGTVSQLVHCGSGIHAWWSEYFIRRYRISASDPLLKLLTDAGMKAVPETNQSPENASTWVLAFPIAAPKGALTVKDVPALKQLEWYKKMVLNWCEHNQSCTIYVKENEWLDVAKWVYDNFDLINGITFYPDDGSKHELPPYESIDKKTYEKMVAALPEIDYSLLSNYETDDNTDGAKTYACAGGVCELV